MACGMLDGYELQIQRELMDWDLTNVSFINLGSNKMPALSFIHKLLDHGNDKIPHI